MKDPATEELLARWLRGDSAAAEEIYRRYIARVERYSMKLTRDTVLSGEVAAEALAQGLAGVREGKTPERWTNWLMGIARKLSALRCEAAARTRVDPDVFLAPGPGPKTVSIRGEIAEVLRGAIENLPTSCRQVVDLHSEEGLDRGAIAERLGIPRENVDRRFARAYEALREAIRRHVTSLVTEPSKVTWSRVAALRPSFRQVFVTHHLEEETREETARLLGLPVETVSARLEAAYDQLSCRGSDDFSFARKEYRVALARRLGDSQP